MEKRLIRIGGKPLLVEIAIKRRNILRGLMFRDFLTDDRGMLFIYPEPAGLVHWMKNCYVPLDIAFFDSGKRLMNVVSLDLYDDPDLSQGPQAASLGLAKFVVETNKDWFRRTGLRPSAPLAF